MHANIPRARHGVSHWPSHATASRTSLRPYCRPSAHGTLVRMESSEEYPYPIQAVVDLARNFSSDHFRFAIKQCRDVIALTLAEDNTSDQQIARVHMLRYLDIQLARATRWIEDETDLMALVLRSQIELRAWAQFVSRSPDDAKRFLYEANIDARELHEKFDKAFPGELRPLPEPIQGSRIKLQERTESENADYKLCSKLLHPSSLLLSGLDEWLFNAEYRKVLAVKVLHYGWSILNIFHDINWTT